MSLSSDISTISSSLNAIKNAIIEKGVTPTGNITTYADAISQIPTASTELTAGIYTFTGLNGTVYTIDLNSRDCLSENTRVLYDQETHTFDIAMGNSAELIEG